MWDGKVKASRGWRCRCVKEDSECMQYFKRLEKEVWREDTDIGGGGEGWMKKDFCWRVDEKINWWKYNRSQGRRGDKTSALQPRSITGCQALTWSETAFCLTKLSSFFFSPSLWCLLSPPSPSSRSCYADFTSPSSENGSLVEQRPLPVFVERLIMRDFIFRFSLLCADLWRMSWKHFDRLKMDGVCAPRATKQTRVQF